MNNKKAKKLRKAVAVACAGQPAYVQTKVMRLVKKNSAMFTTGDNLRVTAMKVIALVKREVAEKQKLMVRKQLSASGKKGAVAGALLREESRNVNPS